MGFNVAEFRAHNKHRNVIPFTTQDCCDSLHYKRWQNEDKEDHKDNDRYECWRRR